MSDGRPSLDFEIRVQGAQQAAGEIGSVSAATQEAGTTAKGSTKTQIEFLGALGQTAKESDNAAKSITELGHAGHNAERIFVGLSEGGLRGTILALRGLGSLLAGGLTSSLIGAGAVLAPFIGAFSVGMIELKRRSKEWEDECAAGLQASTNRAERFQKALAGVTGETDRLKNEMISDLDEVDKRMEATIAYIERSEKRDKTRTSAQREARQAGQDLAQQKEISDASSPEEREAIKAKYAQEQDSYLAAGAKQDIENERIGALVRKKRAEQAQQEARDARDDAEAIASDAEFAASGAIAKGGSSRESDGGKISNRTLDLQAAARVAKAKADSLRNAAAQAQKKFLDISDAQQAIIDDQNAILDAAPIRSTAIDVGLAAKNVDRANQQAIRAQESVAKASRESEPELTRLESEQQQLLAERTSLEDARTRSVAPRASPEQQARTDRLAEIDARLMDVNERQTQISVHLADVQEKADSVTRDHTLAVAANTAALAELPRKIGDAVSAAVASHSGGTITGPDGVTRTIAPGAANDTVTAALDDFFGAMDAQSSSMVQALKQQAQEIRNNGLGG